MKTFRIDTNSEFKKLDINLAIGNFDGVHIGHQKIIKNLIDNSKKMNLKSAILSFAPHPRQYFSNRYEDFNIITEEAKIKLFNDFNVNYYISFNFDKDLASLSAENFIEKILYEKLKIKNLTIGCDFKFGKGREGDISLLKRISSKYNFNITVIDQILFEGTSEAYSSTLIRNNIKEGNFEKVNSLLGRNWQVLGKVIYGDKRASKFNFPTANMVLGNHIKPKKGVYAIRAQYENTYYTGIANFGNRPTVDGKNLLLEVHLFDFNQNIYGKELTVEFLTFIRGEKKFDNFKLLTKQIQEDIKHAKKYHYK